MTEKKDLTRPRAMYIKGEGQGVPSDKTQAVFRVLARAKQERNRGRIVIYLDGSGVVTEFEFLRKF